MEDVDDKLKIFMDEQLPGYVEKVERIPGGFMNYTFRLYLKSEFPSFLSDKSNNHDLLASIHQLKLQTVIAKIAYPYLVGVSEKTPFTIDRQKVEEMALKLFTNMPIEINDNELKSINLSSVSNRNKTILVSKVWFRDEEKSILIIDDHGSLPTIAQWFSSKKKESSVNEIMVASTQAYGEQLARFLIDMQISSIPYVEELELLLKNREINESISVALAAGIEIMRKAGRLSNADEVLSIVDRCLQYDLSRACTDGKVFSHGDFEVQNFLVNEQRSTLGLVDWELAGIRSPAYDSAVFLARVRLPLEYDPENESILSFIDGFMNAYRENAKKKSASWYENEREQYLFAWYLGVMYGAALLYATLIEPCCPAQIGICCHKNNLLALAIDYIRRCCLGPVKDTYDSISQDEFLGRLFQESPTD